LNIKKLGAIIAMMLIAASTYAGDFANAADNGHAPSSCLVAWIAFGLLAIGTVGLFKLHFKGKARVITGTTVLASALALQAGDFADAADRGFGLDRRSRTVESVVNSGIALDRYLRTDPLGALSAVYRFSDNGSYPRQIAGDYLSAADRASVGGASLPGDLIFGSPIMMGPLSGATGASSCKYAQPISQY
jgi:hypothetical protein